MSSIDTIYDTCQRLSQMQNKKAIVRKEEEKKAAEPSGPQKVALLQSKLTDAMSKISELTDVLRNCPEKTEEEYIDEIAEAQREPVGGAAQSSYAGAGASMT